MKRNKKLKLKVVSLFASLGLSFIAVIGVSVGVFASTAQSFKSTFSASYTANNVSATIEGYYKTKLGSEQAMTDGQGNSGITFTATQNTVENASLSAPSQIVLTASDNYVIFKNSFTNNNSLTGRKLLVTLSADNLSNNSNVKTYYFPSSYGDEGAYEDYSKITTYGYTSFNSIPQKTFYIEPQETFYYYILVEIDDDTLDASVAANQSETPFTLTTATQVSSDWTTYVSNNQANWGV